MTPAEREQYQSALANGQLVVQSCADCGRLRFYPKPLCPACGGPGYSWVALSGEGEIYSYTMVERAEQGKRIVVLVTFVEGIRALGNLDEVKEPAIGDRVTLVVGPSTSNAITFRRYPG
jgi:uncharacterized protein